MVAPKPDINPDWRNEDFLPVSIPVLGAHFEVQRAAWVVESGESKSKESQIRNNYKREELRQGFLMHLLTDKEVKLMRVRKEIAMILKEHEGILDMQGFPVKELLAQTDVERLLKEEDIGEIGKTTTEIFKEKILS
ncbi:unnamed protein product [Blepharisma stoltei]|uniref:Uncharacterized protein n=1 Tax=Blepharisma stoltei TaxID=1481888 RepID=A0AAU9JA07_9CILI|nr:unnamed protein product [Blepharisma stoltei]